MNNQFANPKVSVIVPVYNAGHRLRDCIESILSQDLKDIEVIFVLDCPTDGSDKIVLSYAEKDDRVIVIKNEHNLNIGNSRNVGMKAAKGAYLAFCDHDDIVLPNMYKEMYDKAIASHAEMVLGVPQYTYEDATQNQTYFYPEEGDIREKLLSCVVGRDRNGTDAWSFYFSHGVIWDKLYSSDMVQKHGIQFVDNNVITFEDNLFLIECLLKSNKAVVHNSLVYKHTIEDTNTASGASYSKPEKIIAYIEYLYDVLSRHGVLGSYRVNFSNSASRYMIGIITNNLINNKSIRGVSEMTSLINKSKIKKDVFKYVDYTSMIKESKTITKKITYTVLYIYLKWMC